MTRVHVSRRAVVGGLAFGALVVPRGMHAQQASPMASPAACVPLEEGDGCLPVAPEEARVDLAAPIFTNPTVIDHPLFPISTLEQVIQLGEEAGEPLRVEMTLLPGTKTVAWNGAEVDCVRSHFVAYASAELVEVATDFYAQADDGGVWYFGEDVFNYEDGAVVDTDGTWLAGVDGPPGLIMPAAPARGDVYRPENVPGLVFEEVTVTETAVTVEGPRGEVPGAIRTSELLMDGTTEAKVFAPGYGEFGAEAEDESVVVALAVPIDAGAASDVAPLLDAIGEVSDAVGAEDWAAASAAAEALADAWSALAAAGVPPVLGETFEAALMALGEGATAEDADAALEAALITSQVARDLQLRSAPVLPTDLGRLDDRARRVLARLEVEGAERLGGEVAVIDAIWERAGERLDEADRAAVGADLKRLRSAVEAGDAAGVAAAVETLREDLAATG